MFYKSEGVVLRSFDFKESDKIATIFTRDHGLIQLIGRVGKKQTNGMMIPFVQAEFVYATTRGELFRSHEASVINYRLFLRNSIAQLRAAYEMTKAILMSQPINQPSPALYLLFNTYIDGLPKMKYPQVLVASFQLKILRHEGVLGSWLPREWESSTPAEKESLMLLMHCRKLSLLTSLSLPEGLEEKIFRFFQMQMKI